MSEAVLIALISLGGILLTALGVYASNRLNARTANKAKALEAESKALDAEIEKSKVDAAAYTAARDIWGALIDDLRDQIAAQRDDLRVLRERIESLENSRTADRSLTRRIVLYATELRRLLRAAGIDHPDPPTGFADEIPI